MPIWFDLVLILSFAWTGLLYGFLSLWNLEELLERFLSKRMITALSVLLLALNPQLQLNNRHDDNCKRQTELLTITSLWPEYC